MRPVEVLHDKATRGEKITDEEKIRLDAWYTELEREESEVLYGTPEPPESLVAEEEQIDELQQQIADLLSQLTEKTAHLQKVIEQNQILQKEIAVLRTQVATEVGLTAA